MHGGLRYLAKGQVGVAHESAVERGILMTRTAPHLTHAMPMVIPLTAGDRADPRAALAMQGLRAGDLLRAAARTPALAAPPAVAALRRARPSRWCPASAATGCAAACCPTTVSSRTTPGSSPRWPAPPRVRRAHRHPRPAHSTSPATGPRSATSSTGATTAGPGPQRRQRHRRVGRPGRARADAAPEPGHPPRAARRTGCPGSTSRSRRPCPGSLNRFVFTLPQPDGLVYVGLTDEPVDRRGPGRARPPRSPRSTSCSRRSAPRSTGP